MIARGINAIWRQYPVYVYYVWLDDTGAKPGDKDTKCDLDRSGPQSLKYCADEGVYYLYMYNGRGIDWPWGGPKLAPEKPYNINPIVSHHSSQRCYTKTYWRGILAALPDMSNTVCSGPSNLPPGPSKPRASTTIQAKPTLPDSLAPPISPITSILPNDWKAPGHSRFAMEAL